MLTKFAAALLATSLIAGLAIAAQPSGMPASNAAPVVQTQTPSTPAAKTATPAKTVKHTARHRNHVRKHIARSKGHVVHHARHAKPAKTHQAGMTKSTRRS
jgi:LysM repeat protein